MSNFLEYIRSIKARQVETIIEPHVEKLNEEQKRILREDQDLGSGAVRTAILHRGTNDTKPQTGDVVFFHFTIRVDGKPVVLASTERQHGGSGCPHAAALMKGVRIPRGWELALADMTEGQTNVVMTSSTYGFGHPDCGMAVPSCVSADQALQTELTLLKIVSSQEAKPLTSHPSILKITLASGSGWETPRVPFDVEFNAVTSATATICDAMSIPKASGQQWSITLGSKAVPDGIEAALCSMNAGEQAIFAIPTELLKTKLRDQHYWYTLDDHDVSSALVRLHLQSFVEVRDMTGDCQVIKRKLKHGQGSFPIDAPINDATVTIHYSLYGCCDGAPSGEAILNTHGGEPFSFSTGEGIMPTGLEMAVKLMLPGEQSEVTCEPKYGYSTVAGAVPSGVPTDEPICFRLTLMSFVKEGHPEVMSADDIISFGRRQKQSANELYRSGKIEFAMRKYEKTHRTLERFRDVETADQQVALDQLKTSILYNMAAADIEAGNFARAIKFCEQALRSDDRNCKVLLRKAKAHMLNGDHLACRSVCEEVQTMSKDFESQVSLMLASNAGRERAASQRQKAELNNFFSR